MYSSDLGSVHGPVKRRFGRKRICSDEVEREVMQFGYFEIGGVSHA